MKIIFTFHPVKIFDPRDRYDSKVSSQHHHKLMNYNVVARILNYKQIVQKGRDWDTIMIIKNRIRNNSKMITNIKREKMTTCVHVTT